MKSYRTAISAITGVIQVEKKILKLVPYVDQVHRLSVISVEKVEISSETFPFMADIHIIQWKKKKKTSIP